VIRNGTPAKSVDVSDEVIHNFNGGSSIAIDAADGSPEVGVTSRIVIKSNEFDSDTNLRGGCSISSVGSRINMGRSRINAPAQGVPQKDLRRPAA